MTTHYQQVADHISDQIKNGLLQAGEKVPSVRQCSAEMGLSISSVIRGYELLQDQILNRTSSTIRLLCSLPI